MLLYQRLLYDVRRGDGYSVCGQSAGGADSLEGAQSTVLGPEVHIGSRKGLQSILFARLLLFA